MPGGTTEGPKRPKVSIIHRYAVKVNANTLIVIIIKVIYICVAVYMKTVITHHLVNTSPYLVLYGAGMLNGM